ncbi:MAG: hypothetical protein KDC23_00490 [Actinobacteria bacterium]|nr:hypothetical protein [Actinomycetota bacterium]
MGRHNRTSVDPTTDSQAGSGSEITLAHAVKVGLGLSAVALLTALAVGSILAWQTRRKQAAMAVMWQEDPTPTPV